VARKNNPCADCADVPDCAGCLNNQQNAIPVKLYTPKGAVRAMLAGKVLKRGEREHFWKYQGDAGVGFWIHYPDGDTLPLREFSDLYEELA
jgi:hypothetical protein